MWPEKESLLDLSIHIVGHDEPAQDANRLVFQWSNSSEKNFIFSLRLHTLNR